MKLRAGLVRRAEDWRWCSLWRRERRGEEAETMFAMIKGRLGSAVHARTYWSQCQELMLLDVVHDLLFVAD